MHTYLDCVPCFLRQALDGARYFTGDVQVHERILREVLRLVAERDLNRPPPEIGQLVHRRLRELTGVDDPYRDVKRRFNQLLINRLPELRAEIRRGPNPLVAAARLAIAANVIDFGVKSNLTDEEALKALREAGRAPTWGDWSRFQDAVSNAANILYLADNAGEIVLDRLLIEQIGPERVTLAVRGKAVINDATIVDAHEVGLHVLVEVIDNGSDAPGTILNDCSAPFRERFHQADLIIAKGQGNYETLSDTDANIVFMLKLKCPIIAAHIGLPIGTHAVLTQ